MSSLVNDFRLNKLVVQFNTSMSVSVLFSGFAAGGPQLRFNILLILSKDQIQGMCIMPVNSSVCTSQYVPNVVFTVRCPNHLLIPDACFTRHATVRRPRCDSSLASDGTPHTSGSQPVVGGCRPTPCCVAMDVRTPDAQCVHGPWVVCRPWPGRGRTSATGD